MLTLNILEKMVTSKLTVFPVKIVFNIIESTECMNKQK